MGVVEGGEPRRELVAIDDIDRRGEHRGALGAARFGDGRDALVIAADQRERDARLGIVERQGLTDAARGTGDDDAGEFLHGITFGPRSLCALGPDTRVPRRGAAEEYLWSEFVDRKHDGIRPRAGLG